MIASEPARPIKPLPSQLRGMARLHHPRSRTEPSCLVSWVIVGVLVAIILFALVFFFWRRRAAAAAQELDDIEAARELDAREVEEASSSRAAAAARDGSSSTSDDLIYTKDELEASLSRRRAAVDIVELGDEEQ
jgi:cytoskeletal protein RodZ